MASDSSPSAYRPALGLYALAIVALVAASWVQPGRSWGLAWYALFPGLGQGLLILVGLAVPLLLGRRSYAHSVASPSRSNPDPGFYLFALVAIFVYLVAFVVLRTRTHFLGDGYLMLAKLEGAMQLPRVSQTWPYLLQKLVQGLIGHASADPTLATFRLLSWGSGLLLLAGVGHAARQLFAANGDRIIFFLGVATGGYILLFFGYVENYPPLAATVGLLCLAGMMIARGLLSRWVILPLLVVAVFFHGLALALAPACAYVILAGTPLGRKIAALSSRLKIAGLAALIVIALGVAGYLYLTNYFFRLAFVPVVPDAFTVGGYTMFSAAHILDFVDLVFQLCPAIVLLPVVLFAVRRSGISRSPEYLFLALATAGGLAVAWAVDPKLGMPRDWDLFAFAGLPPALLLYCLLSDERLNLRGRAKIAILGITLGLVVLAPRVATQIDFERAVAVFDRATALDRLRTSSVQEVLYRFLNEMGRPDEVERRRAAFERERPDVGWLDQAIQLSRKGEFERATELFRKVLAFNPSHSAAWSNLGATFQWKGDNDSALTCLRIADALTPYDANVHNNLGIVYYSMGDYPRAERHWLESIRLDPDNFKSRDHLLQLYQIQKRSDDYLRLIFQMFDIGTRDDAPVGFVAKIAELHLKRGDFATAAVHYRRALAKGLDTNVVRELERKYPDLHVLESEPPPSAP